MKHSLDNITKLMAKQLLEHRKKFSNILQNKPNIRLRKFNGPKIYQTQLTNPIRIAHLTDQHVGRVTPMATQKKAIKLALSQNPDLVLLTGDFVCHSELFLQDLTELIRLINKPVFAVLGNHDHWTKAEAVKKAVIKGGAEILENANTVIKIKSDYIQLIGVDDAYTNNADINKACKRRKKNIATIGLSHIPEMADAFWEKNIPLVLSGHTHGGQITVAGLHEIILGKFIGHKYIHGVYNSSNSEINNTGMLYVSAGIGSAVMPLRLGEKGKREVAIFDLGN